jgi:hypothetical protein
MPTDCVFFIFDLQHGLDENTQLVGALVLGPVDPPAVPIAEQPLIPQLHVLSLAGQSFLSMCRLLTQLTQQSGGKTTLFRPFLYVEMLVTTCWLVLRIPWDLLAKVGGQPGGQ